MKREMQDTKVWSCPNGHWSRIEFLKDAICPICKEKMELSTRKLEKMIEAFPNSYGLKIDKKRLPDKQHAMLEGWLDSKIRSWML